MWYAVIAEKNGYTASTELYSGFLAGKGGNFLVFVGKIW